MKVTKTEGYPMYNVIHLGANKTASTTLQRHLFSKSSELSYLGADCDIYDSVKGELDSSVSDDDFHFSYKNIKEVFDRKLNPEKTFIYSNENILTSRVPSQCADRLFKLIPNSKILIVIRNQLTAIPSYYANHGAHLKNVPRKYWRKHVEFDDWMEYCTEFMKYSALESFLYDKHLELYRNRFGQENIHILFYEEFINNKNSFIAKLCNIIKADFNHSTNLLIGKHERPRNKENDIQLSNKWLKVISDLYRDDNKLLFSKYKINNPYGYPV